MPKPWLIWPTLLLSCACTIDAKEHQSQRIEDSSDVPVPPYPLSDPHSPLPQVSMVDPISAMQRMLTKRKRDELPFKTNDILANYWHQNSINPISATQYAKKITTDKKDQLRIQVRISRDIRKQQKERLAFRGTVYTFRQDQQLNGKFYEIMSKEGRLVMPYQLVSTTIAQEQAFVFQPTDRRSDQIKLQLPNYNLPGMDTGGPGVAPVAEVLNNALMILTNKFTGEYEYIPRTEEGGLWKTTISNPKYKDFIDKLKKHVYGINIEDSVLSFLPNWIEPKMSYILYKDPQKGPFDMTWGRKKKYKGIHYHCLQYTFPHQGSSQNGFQVKDFDDCPVTMKNSITSPDDGENKMSDDFPIRANDEPTVRQEVAAAVSRDQAFFYFRQTSLPYSRRPIIQTCYNGPWTVAVRDSTGHPVLNHRSTMLSNVYVEKRKDDIDIFIAGNIARSEFTTVEAYFKNCFNHDDPETDKYCRYESLDNELPKTLKFQPLTDQPFNFPVTFCPAVISDDVRKTAMTLLRLKNGR